MEHSRRTKCLPSTTRITCRQKLLTRSSRRARRRRPSRCRRQGPEMIPEVGHFALILAMLIAAVQAVLPIAGAARGDRVWMAVARPAARGQAFFVTLAWLCLVVSFVSSDFSVLNVATNSNSQLPLPYKVAASWGSHEGSMLLWVLMLAWWTFAVATFSRHLPEEMVARVLGIQGLISVGFLLFILTTSDPFDRLSPPADAVHGLRRHVGGIRVCHRRAARREARCGVGPLVAPVDDARVVFPDGWDRARQLGGVLRTRLGRLVVLGSGRKRIVHAMAGRHRTDPLAGGHREARQLPQLD